MACGRGSAYCFSHLLGAIHSVIGICTIKGHRADQTADLSKLHYSSTRLPVVIPPLSVQYSQVVEWLPTDMPHNLSLEEEFDD